MITVNVIVRLMWSQLPIPSRRLHTIKLRSWYYCEYWDGLTLNWPFLWSGQFYSLSLNLTFSIIFVWNDQKSVSVSVSVSVSASASHRFRSFTIRKYFPTSIRWPSSWGKIYYSNFIWELFKTNSSKFEIFRFAKRVVI